MSIKNIINRKIKKNKKGYFILIDPEKKGVDYEKIIKNANKSKVDGILIGGSKKKIKSFNTFVKSIKSMSKIPIILFPGSHQQLSLHADALFSLFLINSNMYKFIIGEQLKASKSIFKSKLEILNTAYLVIANSKKISVVRETGIPVHKRVSLTYIKKYLYLSSIMNFDILYLEAGSGASKIIDNRIIKEARKIVKKPIIVGGGVKNTIHIKKIFNSGADFVVTGNIIEKDPDKILKFADFIREYNEKNI